jgi:hypothetical protein
MSNQGGYKLLRHYSDKEIRQLVKAVYLSYAEVNHSPEDARWEWRKMSIETRTMLTSITIGVYRAIWGE